MEAILRSVDWPNVVLYLWNTVRELKTKTSFILTWSKQTCHLLLNRFHNKGKISGPILLTIKLPSVVWWNVYTSPKKSFSKSSRKSNVKSSSVWPLQPLYKVKFMIWWAYINSERDSSRIKKPNITCNGILVRRAIHLLCSFNVVGSTKLKSHLVWKVCTNNVCRSITLQVYANQQNSRM